jgi:hypothetical protein
VSRQVKRILTPIWHDLLADHFQSQYQLRHQHMHVDLFKIKCMFVFRFVFLEAGLGCSLFSSFFVAGLCLFVVRVLLRNQNEFRPLKRTTLFCVRVVLLFSCCWRMWSVVGGKRWQCSQWLVLSAW